MSKMTDEFPDVDTIFDWSFLGGMKAILSNNERSIYDFFLCVLVKPQIFQDLIKFKLHLGWSFDGQFLLSCD